MGAVAEERAGNSVTLSRQRHQNHDLFICDVLDAIPKDDMASMEHRFSRFQRSRILASFATSTITSSWTLRRACAALLLSRIKTSLFNLLRVAAHGEENAGQPLAN